MCTVELNKEYIMDAYEELYIWFEKSEVGDWIEDENQIRLITIENMCGGKFLMWEWDIDYNGYEIYGITNSIDEAIGFMFE